MGNRIKIANKKARHEQRRKRRRDDLSLTRYNNKIRRKRSQKLFAEGRKERNRKRREELEYVKGLEAEIESERENNQ